MSLADPVLAALADRAEQHYQSAGITVVIPSIPPRAKLIHRAIASVFAQTLPADGIVVTVDNDKEGAGPTRTRGLRQVQTEWVAFLDDDDAFYPQHLQLLHEHAVATGADVVWPWFEVHLGDDPFPESRGKRYDPLHPHTFPVTALVRTAAARGCEFPPPVSDMCSGDDDAFWAQLAARGAKFEPIPDITWMWDHAPPGGNTSGCPGRWEW